MACAFSSPQLRVWATPDAIDLNGSGSLVGQLFTRTFPSRRVTALSPREASRVIDTDGASLLRDYWGGYVAFIQHPAGRVRIVRDPSGTVPAYWRHTRSGIAIAAEVGRPPFSSSDGIRVDGDALALHLLTPHRAGRRTCLSGVFEILPGEALDIHNQRPSNLQLWSPWDYLPSRPGGARADPADLREIAIEIIKAWGDNFPSVLLGMSGGLDSTIVGAGLASSGTRVEAVTMYGHDGESDERDFARLAAANLGYPLTCVNYDAEVIDLTAPVATHVPRPFLAHFGQAIANVRDRFVRDYGTRAFFSGNGGDNIFCLMRSVTPIVDRIRSRAWPLATARTTNDILLLTGADLLSVVRKVVARLRVPRAPISVSGDASWLNKTRLAQAVEGVETHPWLNAPHDILPGAAAHVVMLRRALGNDGLHSRATHPPSIAPLLSQPLVEHCLGIPSWFWVAGGVERSVARQAFKGIIPDSLLNRQSKGGPSGFVHRIFQRNEGEILHRLQEGVLSGMGLIEPVTQQDMIGHMSGNNPMLPQRLLALVAADAWARDWERF